MDNKALYKKSLQKILESSEFKDSPTYTNLLSYLFEFYLKDETPKETTIAVEYLNRDSSFNPSEDPIVRVYIHEIRKRLKTYYQTEGKKEKIRLEIPKGGYGLKFTNIHKKSSQLLIYLSYTLFFLLLCSIIINLMLIKDKISSNKENSLSKICASPIWSDIMNNDKPILIVIGDVFFYEERSKNKQIDRVVRDENINSIEDLELYKEKNSNLSLEINPLTRHTYLIEYASYSLVLLPILNYAHKPISIRLCSKMDVNELKTHDIIYVGYLKCLGLFKLYFEKSHFKLTSYYSFSYYDEKKDSLINYTTQVVPNYHTDYGFVIKFMGPANNPIMLLTGNLLPGTMGVVNKVTNIESVKEIEQKFSNKYNNFPKNFEILYEVFGLKRQFIQSDILYFENMDTLIQGLWTQRPE